MCKATIKLSNGDCLSVSEHDYLIPVIYAIDPKDKSKQVVAKWRPIKLLNYDGAGLIVSILEALYNCPYFYIAGQEDTLYSVNSIVSIKDE